MTVGPSASAARVSSGDGGAGTTPATPGSTVGGAPGTSDDEEVMSAAIDSVSVLVVDDQAPFRRAAGTVVGLAKGFDQVGEAESGEQAVELAIQLAPAMILMDINLPGINGIEATRRILQQVPATMVILLSTYQLSDLPADAQSSGAVAYVHKEELSPKVMRSLWESGGDPTFHAPGSA